MVACFYLLEFNQIFFFSQTAFLLGIAIICTGKGTIPQKVLSGFIHPVVVVLP